MPMLSLPFSRKDSDPSDWLKTLISSTFSAIFIPTAALKILRRALPNFRSIMNHRTSAAFPEFICPDGVFCESDIQLLYSVLGACRSHNRLQFTVLFYFFN